MIMPMTEKRYKLIVPGPTVKGARILKSCTRCRAHKTRCDALFTNPSPCSQCAKRKITCRLDVLTKSIHHENSSEPIEKLAQDLHELKTVLEGLLEKKTRMVEVLKEHVPVVEMETEKVLPISEIQSCVNSPEEEREVQFAPVAEPAFTIQAASGPAFSLSVQEAYELFTNYEVRFNHFLPIFPDDFFSTIDIAEFHRENELLFWSIIITSMLSCPDENVSNSYRGLCEHVKALVVEHCWFKTPRSIYILSALLVLTTWSLPSHDHIADNLSVKYLSVMKNLSLQFGLHKPEFVSEFSHKTKINITSQVNLDTAIRERIYKFIHINSNHWMIHLGLATNSKEDDYILNLIRGGGLNANVMSDTYINSLLRVSMIQLRLNENFHDLLDSNNEAILQLPNQSATTKDITIHMYETILADLQKPLENDSLLDMVIESTRVQLYLHSLTQLDVGIHTYKGYVKKMLLSCFRCIDMFKRQFADLSSFSQLPVHFKFPITQVALVLLRLYKSPLLNAVSDYELVKTKFNELFHGVILRGYSAEWRFSNARFFKLVEKFDKISNLFIMSKSGLGIVSHMKKHLVSSLRYEMIWLVYEHQHGEEADGMEDWGMYGLGEGDKDVIDYVVRSGSIIEYKNSHYPLAY